MKRLHEYIKEDFKLKKKANINFDHPLLEKIIHILYSDDSDNDDEKKFINDWLNSCGEDIKLGVCMTRDDMKSYFAVGEYPFKTLQNVYDIINDDDGDVKFLDHGKSICKTLDLWCKAGGRKFEYYDTEIYANTEADYQVLGYYSQCGKIFFTTVESR